MWHAIIRFAHADGTRASLTRIVYGEECDAQRMAERMRNAFKNIAAGTIRTSLRQVR